VTERDSSPGPGRLSRHPGPAPRLLCLPGAGASAARFEQLRRHLADAAELRTFELPSRGIRFAEPPLTSLSDHVAHFVRRWEGLARAGWWYRDVGGNHFQFERPTRDLLDALREALRFVTDGPGGAPAAPGRG